MALFNPNAKRVVREQGKVRAASSAPRLWPPTIVRLTVRRIRPFTGENWLVRWLTDNLQLLRDERTPVKVIVFEPFCVRKSGNLHQEASIARLLPGALRRLKSCKLLILFCNPPELSRQKRRNGESNPGDRGYLPGHVAWVWVCRLPPIRKQRGRMGRPPDGQTLGDLRGLIGRVLNERLRSHAKFVRIDAKSESRATSLQICMSKWASNSRRPARVGESARQSGSCTTHRFFRRNARRAAPIAPPR